MKRRLLALMASMVLLCAAAALAGCTQSYTPEPQEPKVDASALASPNKLRVGVDTSSYPYAGESSGSISGIEVDIAAAVADELGLKLELVDVGMDGAAAIAGDKADIVMHVDPATAKKDLWTSDIYLPSAVVLFSADPTAKAPTRSDAPVIGAQSASMSAYLVTQEFGSSALKSFDDMKSVFGDLAQGSVKYAAADAVVGMYMANLSTDAKIVAALQKPSGFCIGAASKNKELQKAVAEALKTVQTKGVLNIIEARWLGATIDLSGVALTEGAKGDEAQAVESEPAAEEQPKEEAPAEEAPAEEAPAEESEPVEEAPAEEAPAEEPAPVEEYVEYVEEAPAEQYVEYVEEAPVEQYVEPAPEQPVE